MLPKTSVYVKSYDWQNKWIYFLTEDDHLLQKYNTIWDKPSENIKKEFDNKLVQNLKKHFKTKPKSRGNEVTDFFDKIIPKEGSNDTCSYKLLMII